MADLMIFKRVEKKYLISPAKYDAFMEEFRKHMTMDKYGLHTICNVYYDNDHNELISRSLERPVYKEKFRIRSYGIPTDDDHKIFLEIKKKVKGIVYKRRISLPLKEAYEYLEQGRAPEETDYEERQIMKEIDYMMHLYQLKPSLYLAYDRTAWFGNDDKEFRVTFDQRIRSRREHMRLDEGDEGEELLPEGWRLMEVKVANAFPMWMVRLLEDLEIYPVSFSKFGNIYTVNQGGTMSCSAVF